MAQKKAFLLRLSPEMWQELEAWAAGEFRSVNGQIEFILHEAIRRRNKTLALSAEPHAAPGKEEKS